MAALARIRRLDEAGDEEPDRRAADCGHPRSLTSELLRVPEDLVAVGLGQIPPQPFDGLCRFLRVLRGRAVPVLAELTTDPPQRLSRRRNLLACLRGARVELLPDPFRGLPAHLLRLLADLLLHLASRLLHLFLGLLGRRLLCAGTRRSLSLLDHFAHETPSSVRW